MIENTKFRCGLCSGGPINNCLIQGSLVEGYNHHPLCNECATRIDLWNEYIWDHNHWVDTIDLREHNNYEEYIDVLGIRL